MATIKHSKAPAEAVQKINSIMDRDDVREAMSANEVCTCTHGDTFQYGREDHTPGVGCERRWCTCTWWPTEDED